MRLLFIANPGSGRGRARTLADSFAAALRAASHHVEVAFIDFSQPRGTPQPWHDRLAEFDLAVIFGGDGTVHHLLPRLTAASLPFYHVPLGTENLFARQFGMNADPVTLMNALTRARFQTVDLGDAAGRLFAIMCSAGPDAGVVRRLAATRSGAISHSSYVRPILSELWRPSLGPLTIEVDGKEVLNARHGLLVIGNSPMYALGLNPARRALMNDALLDVVFLPARGPLSLSAWACRIAVGRGAHLDHRAAIFTRGRHIAIRAGRDTPYQLDGDDGGTAGADGATLEISVRPGAARVLSVRD